MFSGHVDGIIEHNKVNVIITPEHKMTLSGVNTLKTEKQLSRRGWWCLVSTKEPFHVFALQRCFWTSTTGAAFQMQRASVQCRQSYTETELFPLHCSFLQRASHFFFFGQWLKMLQTVLTTLTACFHLALSGLPNQTELLDTGMLSGRIIQSPSLEPEWLQTPEMF